jgi:18S rRNA (guanine1575-N7)-methyltransferase
MSPSRRGRPKPAEYHGTDAEEYGTSRWMARNQAATTTEALQLLEGESLGGPLTDAPESYLFLDIGCGTGYSTQTIAEYGFRVVGFDISRDMLVFQSDCENTLLFQADMRYIPLRNAAVDHIISISAFNFAAEGAITKEEMRDLINQAMTELARVGRLGSRFVIEFYPTPLQQEFFLDAAKKHHFSGGLVIQQPGSKKEKKFLVVQHTN